MHYLLLFAIVFLLDLIPAFAPPAWLVAVFFRHTYHLHFVLVVLITALAASLGRLLLAGLTRKLKRYMPKRYSDNLHYSERLLANNRQKFRLIVGLFLCSPLPSAQLFEAAGLLNVALIPLAAAFFFGRLVTISLYLSFAHLTVANFGKLLEGGLSSAWAIAFEVLCILVIVAMFRVRSIMRWLDKHRHENIN